MFRNLSSFWKGKDFLTQVLGDFKEILDKAEQMYKMVIDALLCQKAVPDLKQRVHDIDKEVNHLQRDIRKRVVEHLSLQPAMDLPLSLLLMSVVKDAERLGDYAKNVYEVTELLVKPIDRATFERYFNDIDKDIAALFTQTKEAFMESDDHKAASTFDIEKRLAKRCDRIVEELAKSDLTVNEAVCYTLIARYFKRVIAHLVNIATSVILPVSDLDYFDEQRSVP